MTRICLLYSVKGERSDRVYAELINVGVGRSSHVVGGLSCIRSSDTAAASQYLIGFCLELLCQYLVVSSKKVGMVSLTDRLFYPPSQSYKEEPIIFEKLRWFSFEVVADELKNPAKYKKP